MKKLWWKVKTFLNPYEQPVYYSLMVNRFFQVKFAQDNGLLCGSFTGYYSDSRTNTQRQVLSYDYVWQCEKVEAIDKFPNAEICPIVKSYRVKGYE